MDIKDIENLAELAKIELLPEEKEKLLTEIGDILAYVKQIEGVKVEETEVSYPLKNIWREDDNTQPFFSRDFILKQFPDSKNGFLKVKKIL